MRARFASAPSACGCARSSALRHSALIALILLATGRGVVSRAASRRPLLPAFTRSVAAPDPLAVSRKATCQSLAPLCDIDGAPLQDTLYRSHPKFYNWMLRRKEIEEEWSTHEYNIDKRKPKSTHSGRVRCKPNGHCDVATGGMYLCPPVLYGIKEILDTLRERQKFCVVGSGSLVLEAWTLETTNIDVVSFDTFDTEYQRRIADTIRSTYGESRWVQVVGPFERNTIHVRCGAIVFDTNIAGALNVLHWKKVEETLTIENPYMWVQQNNWANYAAHCASTLCGFRHFGSTSVRNGSCYPDSTVIPRNMHPAVLDAGNEWNERYEFGRWETFRLIEFNNGESGAMKLRDVFSDRSSTLGTVVVNGKRLIRMDDYPFPSSVSIHEQQKRLGRVLNILEAHDVPYVLGVSPLQLLMKGDLDQHVRFLNSHVRKGFVCMHGFDHRTDEGTDRVDTAKWQLGGEFAKYGTDLSTLQAQWTKGNEILRKINRYTTEHFIPPFNSMTQSMVDVLTRNNVTFIHSFDVALRKRAVDAVPYNEAGGNFGGWIEDYRVTPGVVFVVSEWKKTYDFVSKVDAYLRRNPQGSQVTLHWYFDTQRWNWARAYRKFAHRARAVLVRRDNHLSQRWL